MNFDVEQAVRTEAYFADPYAVYRQLRELGPIVQDDAARSTSLFAYADIAAALRDDRLKAARSDHWFDADRAVALAPLATAQRNMMLYSDPPGHTRLRGLVNKAFTPRVVDSLRPRVQAIVDGLLAPLDADSGFDVIETIAFPLPVLVILELLGVPAADRDRLKRLSDAFAAYIGGEARVPGVPEAANAAILELNAYFMRAITRRRAEPGLDLISGMIAAEEQGNVLSENEMLATCILVLIAGHETTTNLIGNGLLALLRNPAERQRFVDGAVPIRGAVDELLRYDSPVQVTSRLVGEPMRVGDVDLEPGTHVDLWLGAANHDPDKFVSPDRLDLGRSENRHLSFGYGVHFCVGAALARLEGEIALLSLLRRFPGLRIDEEPLTYHPAVVFRALRRLKVVA